MIGRSCPITIGTRTSALSTSLTVLRKPSCRLNSSTRPTQSAGAIRPSRRIRRIYPHPVAIRMDLAIANINHTATI